MDPLQQFIQQLPNFVPNFCDRCGGKHNRNDVEIVNRDVEKLTCRLSCKNCGNIYVMQVNIMPDGGVSAKRASIMSDISPTELKKFSNMPKIENEEVLDVIIALDRVGGMDDFTVLFGRDVDDLSSIQ